MGHLVNGIWHDQWYDTTKTGGHFKRTTSGFRHWITADGSAGPTGEAGFKAEKDRYHLYVSHACPWAHRTMIFRTLKGLEDIISLSVVHPDMMTQGWSFADDFDGATGDTLFGFDAMHQLYTKADPHASCRVTVPVLWDKKQNTIVSNESSEIIRMFNSAFDHLTGNTDDYWPVAQREAIEHVNQRIYSNVNNGVYKTGFATTQNAYDEAVVPLFETLDWIEDLLGQHRYLMGDTITEADWRLFTTLIRFDKVYVGHFKCNLRQIRDYPNIWAYLRELYQWPNVARTVHFDHILRHYYYSLDTINPSRVVPISPEIDFLQPHERG